MFSFLLCFSILIWGKPLPPAPPAVLVLVIFVMKSPDQFQVPIIRSRKKEIRNMALSGASDGIDACIQIEEFAFREMNESETDDQYSSSTTMARHRGDCPLMSDLLSRPSRVQAI